MDNSTEGVTLLSAFVFDVVSEYPHVRPLHKMVAGLDSGPDSWCSMQLYNDACKWVEEHIGSMSIRQAGRQIGARAFGTMPASAVTHPHEILNALKYAADNMIRDPKKRGWEILEQKPYGARMRRTQTFNCLLQEGLLLSLVERTPVRTANVTHDKCTRSGAEFCEYAISWL